MKNYLLLFTVFIFFASASLHADDPAMPNNPGGGTGKTYYLHPKGLNSNDGSKAKPWQTLGHGIAQLQAGDMLLVAKGTYYERADEYKNIQIAKSGKPDQYITIKAMPGHRPIIKVDTWNGIELWDAKYVEINGFEIIGLPDPKDLKKNLDKYKKDPRYFGGGNGIGVGGADQVLIEGNRVWHCAHRSDAGNSGISIIHPKDLADAGSSGYGYVIRNNIAYNNINLIPFSQAGIITDGNGIILDMYKDANPKTYAKRTLVANNLCFNNGGRGIHAYKFFKADIINNTMWGNLQTPSLQKIHGELSIEASGDIRAHNNLAVADKGLSFVHSPAKGAKTEVLHNLFSGARSKEVPKDFHAKNIIGANPKLIRPNTNFKLAKFGLKRGSPAINRGLNQLADTYLEQDLAENRRRAGKHVDIGAYKYGSSSSSSSNY